MKKHHFATFFFNRTFYHAAFLSISFLFLALSAFPMTSNAAPFVPPETKKKKGATIRLLTGTSNPKLAQEISDILSIPLTHVDIKRFADKEVFVEIHESIRGEDVFIIQSTSSPANDNLMEILVMLDSLKRASAGRITVCIPYFGYARQDRRSAPRTPISAKLVANLLTKAGADRVLTVDLHSGQIQGFFDLPVDHLLASDLFAQNIRETLLSNISSEKCVIVSPDAGGVIRARMLAKNLGAKLAIVDKRREKPGQSDVLHIIGDVKGCHAIIVDDMVDSAGTLCQAAEALKNAGTLSVRGYSTHAILSGKALERIEKSCLTSLTLTNSIPIKKMTSKIHTLSIAPLLSDAITRIHHSRSLASY